MRKLLRNALTLEEEPEVFLSENPFTDIAIGLATCIGRSIDPVPRQGEWITCRINDSKPSAKKQILESDRIEKTEPECIHLGTIPSTKNLITQKIELTWYHGNTKETSVVTNTSLVELYCRSHWNIFGKLSRLRKALDKNKTVEKLTDTYEVYLYYSLNDLGESNYELRITDKDKEIIHNYQIVPGEDWNQLVIRGKARPKTRYGSSL